MSKLSEIPKGINGRLMTLRLPLSGKRHGTIVSAYASTMTNPDDVKDKFYDDLYSVISAAPRTDKLILLGDFNATVGTDHQTWEGVIGSDGVWPPPFKKVCREWTTDHQHSLPTTNSQKDIMNAPTLRTQASQ